MNKEIYDKFIEAEKLGERKINFVFDTFFKEYEENYEKMAQLMLVIKDRYNFYVNNEALGFIYLNFRAKITSRSEEKLSDKDYDNFCKLADNYSIIRETQN